jgi:hypothetical protein
MHPTGIEPVLFAWKAKIIPLDQGCLFISNQRVGFEPQNPIYFVCTRGPLKPFSIGFTLCRIMQETQKPVIHWNNYTGCTTSATL